MGRGVAYLGNEEEVVLRAWGGVQLNLCRQVAASVLLLKHVEWGNLHSHTYKRAQLTSMSMPAIMP